MTFMKKSKQRLKIENSFSLIPQNSRYYLSDVDFMFMVDSCDGCAVLTANGLGHTRMSYSNYSDSY